MDFVSFGGEVLRVKFYGKIRFLTEDKACAAEKTGNINTLQTTPGIYRTGNNLKPALNNAPAFPITLLCI